MIMMLRPPQGQDHGGGRVTCDIVNNKVRVLRIGGNLAAYLLSTTVPKFCAWSVIRSRSRPCITWDDNPSRFPNLHLWCKTEIFESTVPLAIL